MPFLGALIMLFGLICMYVSYQIVQVSQDDNMCRSLYEIFMKDWANRLNDTSDTFEDFMRIMKQTYYTTLVLGPVGVAGGWLIIMSNL